MIRRIRTSIPVIVCLLVAALGTARSADTALQARYPGLSSGPLNQAVPGVVKGVLLDADGVKITSQDLRAELAKLTSPAKEQYSIYQFAILENMAIGKLIEKEARDWAAKSKTPDLEGQQLMRQYVTSLIGEVAVSDDEAIQFYNDFPSMLGNATYEQAKSAIKSYLREQKIQALLDNHVDTLSARHPVRISDIWAKQQYSKWIKTPVEAARRSGKPTMAKFGSNACKPCLAMAPIIKELEKTYEGRLNVLDINIDKEPVLGSHYCTGPIPLVIFYDKDGKEVSQTVGFRDKTAIEAELAKIGVK